MERDWSDVETFTYKHKKYKKSETVYIAIDNEVYKFQKSQAQALLNKLFDPELVSGNGIKLKKQIHKADNKKTYYGHKIYDYYQENDKTMLAALSNLVK